MDSSNRPLSGRSLVQIQLRVPLFVDSKEKSTMTSVETLCLPVAKKKLVWSIGSKLHLFAPVAQSG